MSHANGNAIVNGSRKTNGGCSPGNTTSTPRREKVEKFVRLVRKREQIRRFDNLRCCVEYSCVFDYQRKLGEFESSLDPSSRTGLLKLSEYDAETCEVIPDDELLIPPAGKAFARVRSNIVPPKNCKEKFFVPYLGEEDDDIKASTQLADDLMDDESEDGKAESGRYDDAEDGRLSPENVINASPFANCIIDSLKQQGDDSDAELERSEENRLSESVARKWDRVFKRLVILSCINEYGPEKFEETVTVLGRALKIREDTVHRYFSNACWRAYQWARENHQDSINNKHRAQLIQLIRTETRKDTSEILASDSVPHFFCRQCKEYDCWIHTETEGHDLTPSQIPYDHSRKDSLPNIDKLKLEEKCQFRASPNCWYFKQKSNGEVPKSNGVSGANTNNVATANGRNDSVAVVSDDEAGNVIFRTNKGSRELLLVLRSIFGDDFCRLAESINRTNIYSVTCTEVGNFVGSELEPVKTTANKRPKKKKTGKKSIRSVVHKPPSEEDRAKPDYQPCEHEGPCTMAVCSCKQNSLHCEKYCRCSSPRVNGQITHDAVWCSNAYRGCSCKGSCQTKQCDCFGNDRECDPDFCSCLHIVNKNGNNKNGTAIPNPESRCANVGLRTNKIVSLVCGHSSVHGWGVYSRHPIAKGTLIGQYTGEFIVKEDGERRGRVYDKKNASYLFLTTKKQNVDSTRLGNKLRYINHSSNANCIPRLRRVDGNVLVGMYALRDIQAFEELLFNYNYDAETGPEFARRFRSNAKKRKVGSKSAAYHVIPDDEDPSN